MHMCVHVLIQKKKSWALGTSSFYLCMSVHVAFWKSSYTCPAEAHFPKPSALMPYDALKWYLDPFLYFTPGLCWHDMIWPKKTPKQNIDIKKSAKTEVLFSILHQIFHQRTAQMIDDHENLGIFLQQLGGSLELMPSMGFWLAISTRDP